MYIEYREKSYPMSELYSLSYVYRMLKKTTVFLSQSNTNTEGVYWIQGEIIFYFRTL